jgi:hypothetical protein
MKIISGISSPLFIKPQLTTVSNSTYSYGIDDFLIYSQSFSILISSSSRAISSSQDVNYFVNSNAVITTLYNISTNIPLNNIQPLYTSIIPSVVTIDNNGNTTYVSNGTASINVKNNHRTRNIVYPSLQTSPSTQTIFNSFVSGSVTDNISSSISSFINGKTASPTTYNEYSSINDSTHAYIRNVNLWSNGIDVTCIPAYRGGTTTGRGILVTPDTMVHAAHVGPGIGTTFYFVDNNNTTVSASVISSSVVAGDLMIARLDRQLTSSIKPAKIFNKLALQPYTTGSFNISNEAFNSHNIFTVQYNQFRTSRIGMWYLPASTVNSIVMPSPTSSMMYPWWSQIVSGDSGNPYFTIVNNEVVAMGTWFYAGGGPAISYYQNEINAAITAIGSSTQLTTASLTGFTTF